MMSVWRRVLESQRLGLWTAVVFSCAVSCGLLVFRALEYEWFTYGFLILDIFLAFIPFAISQALVLFRPRGVVAVVGVLFWLLFFPNAPYLATELMQLSKEGQAPLWFDVVFLMSFAWIGLVLGYVSLIDVHRLVERHLGWLTGWSFAGAALVLGSLGIYIGRFLRWNSWEIFTQPVGLTGDVVEHLLSPSTSPSIYGVIIAYSLVQIAGYLVLRALADLEVSGKSTVDNKRRAA